MSSEKLNLKYKVIEKNEDFHTITVRYWTDIIDEEDLRWSPNNLADGSPDRCKTDISIMLTPEIKFEEDLHNKILQVAPINLLQNEQARKINGKMSIEFADSILYKVYENSISLNNQEQTKPKELTDEDIEKMLNEITNKQITNNT